MSQLAVRGYFLGEQLCVCANVLPGGVILGRSSSVEARSD